MKVSEFAFSQDVYTSRRKSLMEKVPGSQILLIGNNYSSMNYRDNHYPFIQDSNFLYYVGMDMPGLSVIIDSNTGATTLYGNDIDMDMIIWTGNQPTLEQLGERCGISQVKSKSSLKSDIKPGIKYLPTYRSDHELQYQKLLHSGPIEPSLDLILAIIEQRNIKTDSELIELDKAVGITSRLHTHLMKNAKEGMKEYQLVGVGKAFLSDHNCDFSFPPICTINGHTLHNHYHGNTMKNGDMLLIDCGARLNNGYSGDMTRTFPVSGKFTTRQSDLYSIVNSAHNYAVENSNPDTYYKDVHLGAAKTIVEGLIQLGWMKGDPEEAVAAGAHTLFFQHGLGHMMGLDVHDMESLGEVYVGYDSSISKSTEFGLKSLRLARQLKEGNVITIEPGIYIIPELIDKFQSEGKFENFINYSVVNKNRDAGGIRIENNYVVRSTGVEALGNPDGTSVEEVVSIMS